MTAVTVAGVSVTLDGVPIIGGVDLRVSEGEWVGLIGPNGAGKTTLLRAVLGLVPLGTGAVEVLGHAVATTGRQQLARLMAWVPQGPTIPGDATVLDYVLLGRTPHIPYLSEESRRDISVARAALASLDLEGMAGRSMHGLSGGEVQRVVLARAVAQEAPVLLLDEPTSALDLGHRQQVLALVDQMRRDAGLTVISAIHDLTLAAQFCDRVVLMSGGSIAADGRPVDVLSESTIRRHFRASVRVVEDDDGGVIVIPVRVREAAGPPTVPAVVGSVMGGAGDGEEEIPQ